MLLRLCLQDWEITGTVVRSIIDHVCLILLETLEPQAVEAGTRSVAILG